MQQKQKGNFLLGLAGTNGKVRRERATDVWKGLACVEGINWDRIRVFVIDERHGFKEEGECNGKRVTDALSKTLAERGIECPKDLFLLPDTSLELEACAAD